jgi:hypothetical protein
MMLKREVLVESVCSFDRLCSLPGRIVANYSENHQIKRDSEQTHESDCMHRIRASGWSTAPRATKNLLPRTMKYS